MKLSVPIYKLKRNAKLIAREKKLSHSKALDVVANKAGFKNWSLLSRVYGKVAGASDVMSVVSDADLVLLGARPGHGKTVFALEIACEAAKVGKAALVFSLEETAQQIRARLAELNYPESVCSTIRLFDSDAICADMICAKLADCPRGTVVVVDYLQLLDQKRSKPELTDQLQSLQKCAIATGCVLIFITQIDRTFEVSRARMPTINDVRTPNPFDVSIFTKTCFIHDGQLEIRPNE